MNVPHSPKDSKEYHLLNIGIAANVMSLAIPPPENRTPAPLKKEELSNCLSCSMIVYYLGNDAKKTLFIKYTQRNMVWDNLCEFILTAIKAKNGVDALASRSIFNVDSGQKK